MEFTLQSSKLKEKTAALARLVSAHPIVPILDNFLFEIKKNQLTITASDQHTTVVTDLPVRSTIDLSLAVPARMLLDTLKHLPDQSLKFKVDTESYGLVIHSKTGVYKLACENPTDFPKPPVLSKDLKESSFSTELFCEALDQVLFCVSRSNLHLALGGVHIAIRPEGTTFVTSDGNRLVKLHAKKIKGEGISPFTLPGKSLEHFLKLFSATAGTVGDSKLQIDQEHVCFKNDAFALSTQMISEEYPNYENVIPEKTPYKLSLSREQMLHALRIISVYANRSTQQVRLKASENRLELLTEDLNFSNEAKEEINCTYNGKSQEIAFNVKLLTEMLQKVEAKKIDFLLNNNRKPVLILPKTEKQKFELLFLIMPVLYIPGGIPTP